MITKLGSNVGFKGLIINNKEQEQLWKLTNKDTSNMIKDCLSHINNYVSQVTGEDCFLRTNYGCYEKENNEGLPEGKPYCKIQITDRGDNIIASTTVDTTSSQSINKGFRDIAGQCSHNDNAAVQKPDRDTLLYIAETYRNKQC